MLGFLRYRAALRAIGIVRGFHWIDGSFVEDKKIPADIDVFTFFYRPFGKEANDLFAEIVRSNYGLFVPEAVKSEYGCHVEFADISAETPELLIAAAHFWHGLFSHKKQTFKRKGFLQIPVSALSDDEEELRALGGYT